ncbi:hypothetical protein [Nitrogeniibacter aestuarii]|uniref:hypothetical protein n=1 Tax=Nitrogeniibacter aestuarii TaxID=2815343 RepID=UPI001E4334F7|nr:hypothetical protein [Nitrogeniibacter aestuarii]
MAWLFTFIFIAAFAGLFYYLRRRREELREAEEARAQAFLMEMHGRRGGDVMMDSPATGSPAVSSIVAAHAREAEISRVPMGFTPVPEREPDVRPSAIGPVYLERSHLIVWRWLKTALPGHEIFARGSLRRVVGKDRAQKDMLLDFVICDAELRVAGVVDLERARQDLAANRLKREMLDEVGVRYACWNASQLPDKQFLREWLMAQPTVSTQDEIER